MIRDANSHRELREIRREKKRQEAPVSPPCRHIRYIRPDELFRCDEAAQRAIAKA